MLVLVYNLKDGKKPPAAPITSQSSVDEISALGKMEDDKA